MNRTTKALTTGCLLMCGFEANATFSILAVDPITKEIGSAGATCIFGVRELGGAIIINEIIPGRGGVNAQASICINLGPDASTVRLQVEVEANSSYQLQYSQDLNVWMNEPTVSAWTVGSNPSPTLITVSAEQSQRRFYRVQQVTADN